MIFHHTIDPVAFHVFGFPVFWYGISYVASILLCWRYAKCIAHRFHINPSQIDLLITPIVFGVIIGGRLGYVLFYDLHQFLQNPLEILNTRQGGMSFHGGLIGFSIAVAYTCYKHQLATLKIADILGACAPLGLMLGRIANFINSEHVGVPTLQSWGVIFSQVDNLPRHPTQLYEAVCEGLLLWCVINAILYLKKKPLPLGSLCMLFLMGYGIARFALEYVRTPDGSLSFLGITFSFGQWLSVPMIFCGGIGLWMAYYQQAKKQ